MRRLSPAETGEVSGAELTPAERAVLLVLLDHEHKRRGQELSLEACAMVTLDEVRGDGDGGHS